MFSTHLHSLWAAHENDINFTVMFSRTETARVEQKLSGPARVCGGVWQVLWVNCRGLTATGAFYSARPAIGRFTTASPATEAPWRHQIVIKCLALRLTERACHSPADATRSSGFPASWERISRRENSQRQYFRCINYCVFICFGGGIGSR